jgi:hypothetical protein
VDAGHGWLIFAMPPLEAAFHDAEDNDRHELYLMCDDITATLEDLRSKNVEVSEVSDQRWGKLATVTLPGGGKMRAYEPKHPSPLKPSR